MPAINTISVRIKTGSLGNSGGFVRGPSGNPPSTDGDVFIGLCGREFYIDTTSNDFQSGSDKTYILGQGHNIRFDSYNDPRSHYPIHTEDIDLTPAYLRFGPDGREDEWLLEGVTVNVNNGEVILQALEDPANDNLWLGTRCGLYVYLWTLPTPGAPLTGAHVRHRAKAPA